MKRNKKETRKKSGLAYLTNLAPGGKGGGGGSKSRAKGPLEELIFGFLLEESKRIGTRVSEEEIVEDHKVISKDGGFLDEMVPHVHPKDFLPIN